MAIIQGKAQTVSLSLRVGGAPVSIETTATVTAQIFKPDGKTPLSNLISLDPFAAGAQWANGVVVIELTEADTANINYSSVIFLITAKTVGGTKTWSAQLDTGIDEGQSALTTRPLAVSRIRSAMLHGVASRLDIDQSLILDDELWELWLAAEADAQRRLGFPLQPTEIFTQEPTADEVAALNGTPYLVEPGYDLPPDFFGMQSWGSLNLRMRPVLSISSIKFIYPTLEQGFLDVPKNWIKLDHKYGMVHIIPGPGMASAPVSIFTLQMVGAGVNVPHVIRVRYRAGINGRSPEFMDLVDLVKQMALLRILQGAFLPSSGSISADGLSQSFSADLDKFSDSIEHRLSLIKEKILGPVWGVL